MMKKRLVDKKAYERALRWIVRILKKRKIKFNVLGGLAAYSYGSKRMLVDIDLAMRNKDFQRVIPDVKEFVVEMPHFSKSENWQCYYMELNYKGVTIEIGGDKGCKLFDSKTKKWVGLGDILSKPVIKKVFGLNLPVIPKKELISYKSRLMRDVDVIDLKSLVR